MLFILITLLTVCILYKCNDLIVKFGNEYKYIRENRKNVVSFFVAATIFNYMIIITLFNSILFFTNKVFLLILVFSCAVLCKQLGFSYVPKKSREIYDYVFAHRGFHSSTIPENSYLAYKPVIGKFGIEMDVRFLRDGNIICFHDRYTQRLLGVPGKTSNFSYKQLRKLSFSVNENYKVIKLDTALKMVSGKSPVLIEIKGLLTKDYEKALQKIIGSYNGTLYFHCKNIITYFRLKRLYSEKVFWVLNIFRKRFNFLKAKHYKSDVEKLVGMFEEASIEIPSIEDVAQMLVDAFEDSNTVKEICASISGVINNYNTRVEGDHWLLNSLILHRGIVSNIFPEHSKKAFEACVKFAKYTGTRITIELDLVYHDGRVVCYHSDKISDKLGQPKSCAEKKEICDAIPLEDIIDIVKGHERLVSVIFDIKDFRFRNRILEREFIRIIEEKKYTGNFSVQAWNPLVLMYFEKVRPEYIRGQVGHSLSGLVKYVPLSGVPWIVNVLLFNRSHADYCVYDASDFIYVLLKYNKDIKGRPVFIYAPKSMKEIESFIGKSQISGFIVENVLDPQKWSKSYIRKYKAV